jgi:AcrR family transcriptional regulator
MIARRQVLVDAADRLIRENGSTDFTMTALASAAGVSAATPYNLFESKTVLLYVLLNRSLDGVMDLGLKAAAEPDPFVRVMRSAVAVTQFFTADSSFYRALYQVLLGVVDTVHRVAYMKRAITYWRRASQGLDQAGLFPIEYPHEQFSMELLTSFLGITDMWVHGELGDADYTARAGYGALGLTLGLAEGKARKQVLALMEYCKPGLSGEHGFRSGMSLVEAGTARAGSRTMLRGMAPQRISFKNHHDDLT